MGRPIAKLTDLEVKQKSKERGVYGDGGGLWLTVTSSNASSWIFRYSVPGAPARSGEGRRASKRREMGLGSYPAVTLVEARDRATDLRRLLAVGKDPIAERDAKRVLEAHRAASAITFKAAAEKYLSDNSGLWKSGKHAKQWTATLEAHVYPTLGNLPVQEIQVGHIRDVLRPIWTTIPETANRVRGRIDAILDSVLEGDNPARRHGALIKHLPKRPKKRKIKHHAALPFKEVPAFMVKLQGQEGVAARALEFLILTAARTGEVIGAKHREILDEIWTVPAARMKAGEEHRVPLSAPALAIVQQTFQKHGHGFVFPGGKLGKPLSDMALLVLLRRMGRSDITSHGFRSAFRDWAAETTDFAREVAEMALAHTIENKVEAAYRRGDLLEKRRDLMLAWATYCTTPPADADVVPIRLPARR